MQKVIYVTGAPRCGKTTLAIKLKNEQLSILSLDAFSKSIRSVFTDFSLYSASVCIQPDLNKRSFLDLVCKYAECFFDDYPSYVLLIEGCHFKPLEFKEKFPDSKIIFLGRTKSNDDIKNAIDDKEWMASLPEKTKNEYTELIYDYSKEMSLPDENYLYFETDEIDIDKIKKYLFGDDNNE